MAVPQANQYFLNKSDNMQLTFRQDFWLGKIYFAYKATNSDNNTHLYMHIFRKNDN